MKTALSIPLVKVIPSPNSHIGLENHKKIFGHLMAASKYLEDKYCTSPTNVIL
ncbi:MAG: hypothetical protein JNM57_16115 [Cyclobacteriaceae bacterium]|nr:hypothetical protein [Cyclobacteriaceae bacterium]